MSFVLNRMTTIRLRLEQAHFGGAILFRIRLEAPKNFAVLKMRRRFFLIGFDVDDAVFKEGDLSVVHVRTFFARIEEDHAHCGPALQNAKTFFV